MRDIKVALAAIILAITATRNCEAVTGSFIPRSAEALLEDFMEALAEVEVYRDNRSPDLCALDQVFTRSGWVDIGFRWCPKIGSPEPVLCRVRFDDPRHSAWKVVM